MGKEQNEENFLQQAYRHLKAGNLSEGVNSLDIALSEDWENAELRYALKLTGWWTERIKKLEDISVPLEKGLFFLKHWGFFLAFVDRLNEDWDRALYAVRIYVFTNALSHFTEALAVSPERRDETVLFYIGRCNKWLGNYTFAKQSLEELLRLRKDDPATLAELADVNAIINEVRIAKALFREAFFIDPQAIDLRFMESDMLRLLAKRVHSLGWQSPELEEWIPVYGTLWQVFNVKRELKAVELGKLKQHIYTLEQELKNHPEQSTTLSARLLNRYFWLIDHYVNTREEEARIQETLLKIKLLNEDIYTQYTGTESW